jgi:serine/threonine-protein kinase RsbW
MSGTALAFTTRLLDGTVTVIEVSGEIDLYNSTKLRNHFKALRQEGAKRFVLDFSRTTYMDSSGIGLLVFFFTSSRQRNIRIRFVNFTAQITRLLSMTRLTSVLPIASNMDEALRDVRMGCADHKTRKCIVVDGTSPLFDKKNMEYLELRIGLDQVRRLSLLIAQKAPSENRELNLLEQQISELVKNALKHGNKGDQTKKVRIWYSLTTSHARLIVEDEGTGFQNIDAWNAFYETKTRLHQQQNYDSLLGYLSFRTASSDAADGGNALFAALEYWNEGVVFNEKRNAVAVKRLFYH